MDVKLSVDKLEAIELKLVDGKLMMSFLGDQEIQDLITANEEAQAQAEQ
jgi:hypothetical protein